MQNRCVQFFLLSFLLFCSPWAKTLCFQGESPGGKIMKKCEKVWKNVINYETILPCSCCPLVFPWTEQVKTGRWTSTTWLDTFVGTSVAAFVARFVGAFSTLPALQKNSVNIFFVFAWEFCIEKWRGFLVNFFWSPSPTKRSTKSPRKIRGKFGAKFGAKFGTKIRKIRETFVLQLFWPNFFQSSPDRGQSRRSSDLVNFRGPD